MPRPYRRDCFVGINTNTLMRITLPLLLAFAFVGTAPAQAQVDNGSFESWVITPSDTIPEYWSVPGQFGQGRSNDAHTGSFSTVLWNWYWYAEGYTANGASIEPGLDGMPISGTPESLTGWYKRPASFIDTAMEQKAVVRVLLTHWNADLHKRDTVAMGSIHLNDQEAWAPFEVVLNYTSSEVPDTVVIQMQSCLGCMCQGSSIDGTCAYLYVDDLAFSFGQGTEEFREEDVRIDHLASGDLQVHVPARVQLPVHVRIWDASGRLVGEQLVRDRTEKLRAPRTQGVFTFEANTKGERVGKGRFVF